MNCAECETALSFEHSGEEIENHLRICGECRAFATELRANAEALQSMASDTFPALTIPSARPVAPGFAALAAAAMLLLMFGAVHFREQKLPPAHYALAPMKFDPPPLAPVRHVLKHFAKPVRASAPLMVKMLTSDPNVVIYWQIDAANEGEQR